MRALPLRDVRKFKETKKHFDRVREDMEIAQVKNAQAPRNKPHEVEEATGTLSITRKCFRHLALDYVLQVGTLAPLHNQWKCSYHIQEYRQCYSDNISLVSTKSKAMDIMSGCSSCLPRTGILESGVLKMKKEMIYVVPPSKCQHLYSVSFSAV